MKKTKDTAPQVLSSVTISASQQAGARSLIELLEREHQDAQQRINARRLALNRWADDLRTELNLPAGRYRFEAGEMAFVDASKVTGKPL